MAVAVRQPGGPQRIVPLSKADETSLRLGEIAGFYVIGDSRLANRVHDPGAATGPAGFLRDSGE
jgi:hypothetical protein